MNEQARSGVAILTGTGENSEQRSSDSGIQIGVLTDDVRRLAAQFQRDLGEIVD